MLYYYTYEFVLHSQAICLRASLHAITGSLFHPHKDLLICNRQFPDPDTDCIIYRICNSRRWGIDNDLTNGFCTKRARRLVAAFKFYLDFSDIQTAWYFVLHKGVFMDTSLVGISYILLHCHANSLCQTAFCLYSGQIFI